MIYRAAAVQESAIGTKRTCASALQMSAFESGADIPRSSLRKGVVESLI